MKTLFSSLAVALALSVVPSASAGVFVHAGPVTVAVGGGRPHYYRPVAVRPIPAPFAVPGPAVVAPPAAALPARVITPREMRRIREEARELRQEIRQAGPVVTPREQREIREQARELRQAIRQAVGN